MRAAVRNIRRVQSCTMYKASDIKILSDCRKNNFRLPLYVTEVHRALCNNEITPKNSRSNITTLAHDFGDKDSSFLCRHFQTEVLN